MPNSPGRCSARTLRLMVSAAYDLLARMKYMIPTEGPPGAASAIGNGDSGSMLSTGICERRPSRFSRAERHLASSSEPAGRSTPFQS